MDRATDLRASLPGLLIQDYPYFSVYIVDYGSRDDLADLFSSLPDPRLNLIRVPRPAYFSFSRSKNIGARYSESELLLFLNGDSLVAGRHWLSRVVHDLLHSRAIDRTWFADWRRQAGYPDIQAEAPQFQHRLRKVYVHGDPAALLVERAVFQRIGGFNEFLEGWGYEDTEILGRLEMCGYARVEMAGVGFLTQADEEDLRRENHRNKDIRQNWAVNRLVSDGMIGLKGPAFAVAPRPGWDAETVLLSHGSGRLHERDWVMNAGVLSDAELDELRRLRDSCLGLSAEAVSRMSHQGAPRRDRKTAVAAATTVAHYREDAGDPFVIREVLEERCYLPERVLRQVEPGGLVIDCGAHIGAFTLQAVNELAPALCIAIEPVPANFELLRKNVDSAGVVDRVELVAVALWDSETRLTLRGNRSESGSHSALPEMIRHLPDSRSERTSVRATSLDALLDELGLAGQRISLIKLDVEGAEERVLQGARRTLARTGAVVGELHGEVVSRATLEDLLDGFDVTYGEVWSERRLQTFWAIRRKPADPPDRQGRDQA